MKKVRAYIKGVAVSIPDYILTNEELSQMVDTSDEWIIERIGIKERRILRNRNKASSDLGTEAVKKLLEKTNTDPSEIDLVICATVTPDMIFPANANIISDKVGIKNAFSFDLNAGCSGFLYALSVGAKFIESEKYKKVIVIGAEKMSSIIDYTDRTTSPIFGDGAGAVLLEPTTEEIGIIDEFLQSDGVGRVHLHQKAGGALLPPSIETVCNRLHYVYQEGQAVFKWAVTKMAEAALEVMKRNNLTFEDINWFVPHQANLRIIDAAYKRLNLPPEKVMINIQKYGNTTSATLPICLNDWEHKLKKGDKLILATFGAGFTWGAMYLIWGYNSN